MQYLGGVCMRAQKCLSGMVAPASVNTPPKTNKFKTRQLVAHLEVKVGENHKLEASQGYSGTWSQ